MRVIADDYDHPGKDLRPLLETVRYFGAEDYSVERLPEGHQREAIHALMSIPTELSEHVQVVAIVETTALTRFGTKTGLYYELLANQDVPFADGDLQLASANARLVLCMGEKYEFPLAGNMQGINLQEILSGLGEAPSHEAFGEAIRAAVLERMKEHVRDVSAELDTSRTAVTSWSAQLQRVEQLEKLMRGEPIP